MDDIAKIAAFGFVGLLIMAIGISIAVNASTGGTRSDSTDSSAIFVTVGGIVVGAALLTAIASALL